MWTETLRIGSGLIWWSPERQTLMKLTNTLSINRLSTCTGAVITPPPLWSLHIKLKKPFFKVCVISCSDEILLCLKKKKIELNRTSAVQGHPGWLHLLRRICDHSRTAANGPRGQADLAAVPKVKQWNLTQDCAGVVAALVLIHWILKKKTTVLEQHWS